ncbi:hypothetical protein AAC387_Pa05g0135 [Persea americana]
MVSGSGRKMATSRKLDVLGCLTSSKSFSRTSVVMDALHQYIKELTSEVLQYIKELTSEVEMLNKQYSNLMKKCQVPTEVEVERIEEGFLVRVSSKKGRDLLVTVLEAFEEMGLNVLQARVSCNHSFWMEAIAEAENERLDMDVQAVKQAVLKALENQGKEVPMATSKKSGGL